jgi:hypothetical protein
MSAKEVQETSAQCRREMDHAGMLVTDVVATLKSGSAVPTISAWGGTLIKFQVSSSDPRSDMQQRIDGRYGR